MSKHYIKKSSAEDLYFTSSSAYDVPQWVPLDKATAYISESAVERAKTQLLRAGSYSIVIEARGEFRPTIADSEIDNQIRNSELQSASPLELENDELDIDVFIKVNADEIDDESSLELDDQDYVDVDDESQINDDIALSDDELDGELEDELDVDLDLDDELEADLADLPRLKESDTRYDEYVRRQQDVKDAYRVYQNLKRNGSDPREMATAYMKYRQALIAADRVHPPGTRGANDNFSRFKKELDNGTLDIKQAAKDPRNDLRESSIHTDGDKAAKDSQSIAIKNVPDVTTIKFNDPAIVNDKARDSDNDVASNLESKITVPAEVVADLKRLAKEYSVEEQDNVASSFNLTMVGAIEDLLNALSYKDVDGFKRAQVVYQSFMSALTDKFPESVKTFLLGGGTKMSLKSLFKDKVGGNRREGVEGVSEAAEPMKQDKFLAVQKAYLDRTKLKLDIKNAEGEKAPDAAKIGQLKNDLKRSEDIVHNYESGKKTVKESLEPGFYLVKEGKAIISKPLKSFAAATAVYDALTENMRKGVSVEEVFEAVVDDGSELSKLQQRLQNLKTAQRELSKPTNQREYDAYDDIVRDIKSVEAQIAKLGE